MAWRSATAATDQPLGGQAQQGELPRHARSVPAGADDRRPAQYGPPVMGMSDLDGPAGRRRRRLVAAVIVLTMVLGAGAVLLSFF